jgi:hypothetical protein
LLTERAAWRSGNLFSLRLLEFEQAHSQTRGDQVCT